MEKGRKKKEEKEEKEKERKKERKEKKRERERERKKEQLERIFKQETLFCEPFLFFKFWNRAKNEEEETKKVWEEERELRKGAKKINRNKWPPFQNGFSTACKLHITFF